MNGGTFNLTPASFDIIFPSRFDSHVETWHKDKWLKDWRVRADRAAQAMHDEAQRIKDYVNRS